MKNFHTCKCTCIVSDVDTILERKSDKNIIGCLCFSHYLKAPACLHLETLLGGKVPVCSAANRMST